MIVGLDTTCHYASQLGLSYSQHYNQKDEELSDEMKNNYRFIQENLSSLVQPLLQSNFTLTNGVFSSLYISSYFDPKCPIEKVLKLLYHTVKLNDIVSTDQPSNELANILSTQSCSLWSKIDDTEKNKELVEDFFNIFTFPKSSSHEEIEYIADRFLELIELYPEMLIFLPPIVENAEASIPNNEEFLFNIYRQVLPIIAKVDNLSNVFAYPDNLFSTQTAAQLSSVEPNLFIDFFEQLIQRGLSTLDSDGQPDTEIGFTVTETIEFSLDLLAKHTEVSSELSIPLLELALSPLEALDYNEPPEGIFRCLRALSETVIELSSCSIYPLMPIITKLENIINQVGGTLSQQSLLQQCLFAHSKKQKG